MVPRSDRGRLAGFHTPEVGTLLSHSPTCLDMLVRGLALCDAFRLSRPKQRLQPRCWLFSASALRALLHSCRSMSLLALRPDTLRCVCATSLTAPRAARELGDARSRCRSSSPVHPHDHPPVAVRDPHLSVPAVLTPKSSWSAFSLGVSSSLVGVSLNPLARCLCHHWPRLALPAVCSPPKWILAGPAVSGVFPSDASHAAPRMVCSALRPEGRLSVVE